MGHSPAMTASEDELGAPLLALRTDPMTGLAALSRESRGALRQGASLAVVDLVHFRDRVNMPFGHDVGDRVLVAVGRRLAEGLAPWRVFRSGGDEFTVEVRDALDRASAERFAGRIAEILAAPFEETGEGLEATVGICLRRIAGDPFPVWAEAQRGADVEAPQRGLPFHIAGDSA